MTEVNAKQLRAQLRHYLDRLEKGEEITIIRHSMIIGRMVPAHPSPKLEPLPAHQIADGREVVFRQYQFKDDDAIRELHETALKAAGIFDETGAFRDFDLDNINGAYLGQAGDFIVGLIDEKIVAMGAFRMNFGGQTGEAELKRMRVRPDLQGQGIGGRLLELLEERARQAGYTAIVLDTIPNEGLAQKLYESHGYTQTRREQAGKFEIACYHKSLQA